MGSHDFSLPLSSSGSARKSRAFPSASATSGHSAYRIVNLSPDSLRARARLTNLAVLLLTGGLVFSILLNARFILFSGPTEGAYDPWSGQGTRPIGMTAVHRVPPSIEATIQRDPRTTSMNHLIMIPGHAIWHGHESDSVLDESEWVLDAIQKGGSIKTYVKHIREGIRIASEDSNSLLVFSGGQTRPPPAPLLSEAQSYLAIAQALSLLPPLSSPLPSAGALPVSARVTTEEFALDSYQNLLFALARFKEFTGNYPSKVTTVGYGMKRNRFVDLHRATLRFPQESFEYIGIDDDGDTTDSYAGELKYGYTPFITSPSGCHPPLSIKRLTRNPYSRYHPYHTSCPELTPLFEWCPPMGEGVYMEALPWANDSDATDEVRWGREQE